MAKAPPDPLYTCRGNMSLIHCIYPVIKEGNELMYAGTIKGLVHVWDLKTKREVTCHEVGNSACLNVLQHKDTFITQLKADSIKFWTEEKYSWKLTKIINHDYCGYCHMSIFKDLIFLPNMNKGIILFDFNRNKEIYFGENDKLGQAMCLKSVVSKDYILAAYESGTLCLYNSQLKLLSEHNFSEDCPMALDFCESTNEGVFGNASSKFYKFKISEGSHLIEKCLEGNLTNPGVGSIAINKEGSLCVLGCWDGRIRFYTMKKFKLLAVLIHHVKAIHHVLFINEEMSFCDKGLLAAGGSDGRISFWNLYTTSKTKYKDVAIKPDENGDSKTDGVVIGDKATSEPKEIVNFIVIHNKNKFEVEFPLDDTISKLKLHLQNIINVPQPLQKVMHKGLAKDDKTLRDVGITTGAKVMVVGSKLDDVLAVSTPSAQVADEKSHVTSKEPLCHQKAHKKIIDKGIPDDVLPGIRDTKEPLPPFPLCGMLNTNGGKVRLTFKLELDQLWIGTKERTEKIPMTSIKNIVSEPIEGHPQYHIMGIQLGTTEGSRYWVYWVPAQYIDSIKDAVLGPWATQKVKTKKK